MRILIVLAVLIAPTLAQASPERAKGVAAFSAGNPREARVHLMNAIKADPADGLARALQARVALALGDGVTAAGELQRAREIGFPADRTRHLMAEAWLLQGQPDRALAEADPVGIPARYGVYAARIRARAKAILGDVAGASAAYGDALALAPEHAPLWTDIARFRRDTGEIAGAIAASARAVAIDPRNVDALVTRGVLVRGQFGLVAALPWFDRAILIDPGHVDALIEKAATLGDLGRNREMLAASRAVLALDGGNARAFYLHAVMAARAGRAELARALLQRVGDRMDDVPGAMLLSGALAIEAGAHDQAITRLDALLARQPDNLAARRLIGLALWRRGDPAGTIAALEPLVVRDDGYALALTGRAHERLGDRVAAAVFLDRAARPEARDTLLAGGQPIEALAQDVVERPGDAGAVVRFIRALAARGDGSGALARAEALRRDNPGAPAAHMIVGDVLAAGGRWPEAARAYAAAADLDFSEGVALRLADARRRAGDAAGSAATLSLFLAQSPRGVAALHAASDLMLAAERWDEAIAILDSLRRRIGNGDAAILNNLAWAWAGKGDEVRALAFARAAYAQAPANAALADNLGWLLVRGDVDAAYGVRLIEQAVAMAPGDPGLRWHLAQAYASIGRANDARREALLVADNDIFPFRDDARELAAALI